MLVAPGTLLRLLELIRIVIEASETINKTHYIVFYLDVTFGDEV